MAANRIYIQVDFQADTAEQNVDELNKKIGQIGTASEESSKKGTAAVKGFSAAIQQTESAMDKLSTTIAGAGLASAGKHFLEMGDDLNRLRMGLEATSNDLGLFDRLTAISEKSGFALNKLAASAQNLVNAGMGGREASTEIQLIVDQAARAGKGADAVEQLTSKLQTMIDKIKVSGRDVKSFGDIGILPLQTLMEKFHLSAQQLKSDLGFIDPHKFISQMNEAMAAMSGGAAAKRAEELPSAQFGILQTKVSELAQELETALAPALIEIAKAFGGLIEQMRGIVAGFQELPDWVKQTAVNLGLLAIAIKAVSAAWGLWTMLPGIISSLRFMGPILSGLIQYMTAFVEGAAGLTTIATGAAAATTGMEAFAAAVATALPPVLALVAAWTLWKDIDEYFIQTSNSRQKAMEDAFNKQEDLVADAQMLEEKLNAMRGTKTGYGETRKRTLESMDIESLEKYITQLQELDRKKTTLFEADEAKIKRAGEVGARLLADAQKRYAKAGQESIAALTYAYEEHFKETAISAKGHADTLKALEIDVTAEVVKQLEVVKKAREKALLEVAALQRKTNIARIEAIPDDTYQAKMDIAGAKYSERRDQYQTDRQEAIRLDAELTAKQVAGVEKALKLEMQQARTPGQREEALKSSFANIERLNQLHQEQMKTQDSLYAAKVADAREQADKEYYAAAFAREKQFREQQLQLDLQAINARRDLEVASINAVEAHTLAERLSQIEATKTASIKALEEVQAAQKLQTADARQQQLNALQESGILTTDQIKARMAEFDRRAGFEQQSQALETAKQIQEIRIESWRAGNEAIIAQQRQVYDQALNFAGEMFDALTDKSKSVWAAIGDVIKRTLLGAIKTVITSQLAASLTMMLGYGTVGFAGGPLGQKIPVFSGAGTPPAWSLPKIESPRTTVQYDNERDRMMAEAIVQPMGNAAGALINAAGALTSAAGALTSSAAVGGASPMAVQSATQAVNNAGVNVSLAGARTGGADIYDVGAATPSEMGVYGNLPLSHAAGWQLPGMMPGMSGSTGLGGTGSATGLARLSNYGASLAAMIGTSMFTSSLSRKGLGAGLQGIGGAAMAGASLAKMFPGVFGDLGTLGGALAGAGLGVGIGTAAYGLKRGGIAGAGLSVGGGALAGAAIGSIFPGIGTAIGAAAGALVGLAAGLIRLATPTKDEQVRTLVKRVYGVDIAQQGIRQQIVDLANQKYGGDVRLAVYSSEVQELVRLYAMSTGQSIGGMPRPMYSATFAQSGAGGLQVQPVYSGGQLVASPYEGTTTTQFANAASPLYVQLNPAQARDLFAGQVVQVLGDNPGAVGSANATAARSGQSRQAQTGAFLEPATVMR